MIQHLLAYSQIILYGCLVFASDVQSQNITEIISDALSEQGSTIDNAEPVWEYEPRIWTPEAVKPEEDFSPDLSYRDDVDYAETRDLFTAKEEDDKKPRKFMREKSYFYETNLRRIFGEISPSQSRLKTRQQQDADKCDQYRVDIRETVICDRQRCDKLNFEWPKYDNQIIVVQTTKAGMRFYQAHLAFDTPRRSSVDLDSTLRIHQKHNSSSLKVPIKFDILDLFKPKPSSTITTASPTSPTTTTAPPPDSNSTTTTASPTTTTPETDQFGAPSNSSTSATPATPRDQSMNGQDNNQTQLVTTFRLDTRRRVQRIVGFGGALSDATCRNIKSLSPTMAKSLMEDYFGPKGVQYSLVRMSMGSSDFSLTPYTNNDKPYKPRQTGNRQNAMNETDDVEMKHFHLTEEDFDFKLPMARQAIALSKRQIKFFSSLWSPPIWMKNNSHIVHGYLKGDVYGPYYKALADLIVKWLEAYREQGIEFWGTTGLNEPVTGIKPFIFHNSLGITRDDYITWIKLYLGPMLRLRGFKDLKLIAVDDNKGWMQNWAGGLLEDEEVAKYVSGIAVHWYMNDDYDNLNFLINKFPDKFILATEACNGYFPFQVHVLPGDWDRGVAYMYDIMKMMHKNAVGWVDWNMVLNLQGGPSWPGNFVDSPVLVNAERDEYYKSPAFYAIGHYSRFVVPDSYRLDHRLANARFDYPLEASGFYTPDKYVVIVVLNANKHQVPFRVIVDRQLVKTVNLKQESFNTIVFKWNKSR